MDFDVSSYPEGLAELLTTDERCELGAGKPNQTVSQQLRTLQLDIVFRPHKIADTSMAAACHSGLWLLHNFLDESHKISQENSSATGSFWHAIMHRREGDFSNAKIWFRRVGEHPVFELLATGAQPLLDVCDNGPIRQLQGQDWDPYVFIDLCEEAVCNGSDTSVLGKIARCEWELLFDYSFKAAIATS